MRLKLFILIFLVCKMNCFGQKIDVSYNSYLKAKILTYYHEGQQIIFQKLIFDSTKKIEYRVGLIIYRTSISSDEFIREGAAIKFDDNSKIVFGDKPDINYLYSGRHEFAVKHILSPIEIDSLRNKEIISIEILNYEKNIDRFLKSDIKQAFNKLINEQ